MNTKYNIKDMVGGDKKVNFVRYRKGELIFVTDNGFEFPVPITDTGDGVYHAQDTAMLYMKYIKKQIKNIEATENGE